MTTYELMASAFTVVPKGEPMFSEQATTVRLEDEGAGLFVVVEQTGRTDIGKVSFCTEEWPTIKEAIEALLVRCLEQNAKEAV